MELLRQIDGYCERVGPGYWAEPVNAVTNAAFVLVALWMWRRSAGVPVARVLSVVLGLIGIGSYLFHTHAQTWAALADVLPILAFILTYIYLATTRFLLQPAWVGVASVIGFFPYAILLTPVFQHLPFFNVSSVYWTVPLLIAIYGVGLRRREPEFARGLFIGAAILCLSLTFRSLDMTLCAQIPLGTHFMWHILNAIMLGWMIEVYRRYMTRA